MGKLTRRGFIKSSMAAGAAMVLAAPYSRVRGANSDIRVAVVGTGGQGSGHIKYFNELSGVRVVAVCDADESHAKQNAGYFEKRNETVETYTDVRKLLEDKSIDAITSATPNHWHSLVTVWACQAGKDVYIEKPVSHEIWEGRKMVEAARKTVAAVTSYMSAISVVFLPRAESRTMWARRTTRLSRSLWIKWDNSVCSDWVSFRTYTGLDMNESFRLKIYIFMSVHRQNP